MSCFSTVALSEPMEMLPYSEKLLQAVDKGLGLWYIRIKGPAKWMPGDFLVDYACNRPRTMTARDNVVGAE